MKRLFSVFRMMCCGFIFFAAQAYSLTPAQDLVVKMSRSAKTLSYKGYFSYERGKQSTSYKIVHWVHDDIEKQRLVFLDGKPFEIINDGHSVQCIHAGDVQDANAIHSVSANPVAVLSTSLASIWENYNVEIAGTTRIADRQVTRVQLTPKDQHRYPFVFFVDDETGLMLKMIILNSQQQPLERFHFVTVEYSGVTESDLIPQIKDYKIANHVNPLTETHNANEKVWDIKWRPKGFVQEKSKMMNWGVDVVDQQVYMFSDGLSAFSIFVEPFEGEVKGDISSQVGSTSAISHYVQFSGKMFLVTVVGEIPIMTAKQIALSMRPLL